MFGLPVALLRAVLVDFFASGSRGMGMGDTQRGAGVSCVLLNSWLACDADTFRFFGSLGSSETKSTGKQRARKVYTSCWQREEMREGKGTLQIKQIFKKIAQAHSYTFLEQV